MSITIYWDRQVFTRNWEGGDVANSIVTNIELDVLASETMSLSSTLTEHPIDEGSPVADHIIPSSETIELEVLHSQSPTHLRVENAAMRDVGSASVITIDPEVDRVGEAIDVLRDLVKNGAEINVEGLRRDVEGWVITDVSLPQTVETADLLTASITLREVRKASLQEIDRPAPRVERGRRNTNNGRQAPENTGSTETVNRSVLAAGIDEAAPLGQAAREYLGGLLGGGS